MRTERGILDEFHRKHPGIRVRAENIPGPGQYVPKLLMTYVAGNPPDLMTLDASSAAVFIDNGLLEDLTGLIEADREFKLSDYFPNVVDIARRGKKLYAIPGDFTPMVVIYNKRLFDEAHVPYPREGWTRREFLAAAKALTVRAPRDDARPLRYGFQFNKSMPMWFPWIWANGGDVLDPNGTRAGGYLDGPQTVDAVQFLVDLIRVHRVAPSLSETAAVGVDLFRTGRAAMTMTGHWSLIEYRADKMDVGVASIPSDVGRHVTVMYEAGMAISRVSRHKQAAWQYIKHMAGPAVQRKHVASGLAISANMTVANAFAGNPIEDVFLQEVRVARRPWGSRVERYELVEDLGREMIEDILQANIPVQQAAARTARLIDVELKQP
jgi:multiple sugar transport system substrate-binding protein